MNTLIRPEKPAITDMLRTLSPEKLAEVRALMQNLSAQEGV
jgi:hypothetical protein